MLSHFSCVRLCVALWTTAYQTPLSMGLSRQEYWSGLPCPLPGDLPDSGVKFASPKSLMSPELAGGFFTTSASWEALIAACSIIFSVVTCGIWFLDQELNPGPLHWEHRFLTTVPPGQSLNWAISFSFFWGGGAISYFSSILTSPHSSMKGRVSRVFTLLHMGHFFFCVLN